MNDPRIKSATDVITQYCWLIACEQNLIYVFGDLEGPRTRVLLTNEQIIAAARSRIVKLDEAVQSVVASLPDVNLIAAYQRTDGAPGNPEADALLAELERRRLKV